MIRAGVVAEPVIEPFPCKYLALKFAVLPFIERRRLPSEPVPLIDQRQRRSVKVAGIEVNSMLAWSLGTSINWILVQALMSSSLFRKGQRLNR